jgi:WD40 repeat protein
MTGIRAFPAALYRLAAYVYTRLRRFRFRYDIFISYGRSDGRSYAEGLKRQLERLDFTCFLDSENLPAGHALTDSLLAALHSSACMVVVGSPGAVDRNRKWVALEVAEFERTGRRLIPIDFERSLGEAEWPVLKNRDLVWVDEKHVALERGSPSAGVIESIERVFDYTKRNVLVRALTVAITSAIIVGAAVAGLMLRAETTKVWLANRQIEVSKVLSDAASRKSQREAAAAETARADARIAETDALRQQRIAAENVALARERLIDTAQEQGRLELLVGRKLQALVYLREAYAQRPDDEALRFLLRTASRALVPAIDTGDDRDPVGASWNAAGTRLLTATIGRGAPLVHLMDTSGEIIHTMGRDGSLRNLEYATFFGKDEQILTIADKVSLWNAKGQWIKDLPPIEREERGKFVALSPDQTRLIAASGAELRIVEIATGRITPIQPGDANPAGEASRSVVWSPQSNRIGVTGHTGTVRVYDGHTGAVVRTLSGGPFSRIVWSPDGKLLAALHGDSPVITIWNVEADKVIGPLDERLEGGIMDFAFSPDGRQFVAAASTQTVAWDARDWFDEEGRPLIRWKEMTDIIRLFFTPDSRKLVSTGIMDSQLRMRDADTGLLQEALGSTYPSASLLAFTRDGHKLATATFSGVRIWDLARDLRSRVLADVESDGVALAVSRDGKRIVTVRQGSGTIEVYDGRGSRVDAFEPDGLVDPRTAHLSDDGGSLAVVSDGMCAVVDLASHSVREISSVGMYGDCRFHGDDRLLLWNADDAWVQSLAHPPQSKQRFGVDELIGDVIASADRSLVVVAEALPERVTVFDGASGRSLYSRRGHDPVFDPSGGLLAVAPASRAESQEVMLYDARTGRTVQRLPHPSRVARLAFSPDGKQLISGSEDFPRIWSVQSGKLLHTLGDQPGGTADVAFSPTGGRALTTDSHHDVRIWDAVRGRLLYKLETRGQGLCRAQFVNGGAGIVSFAVRDYPVRLTEVMLWDTAIETRPAGELEALIRRWTPPEILPPAGRAAAP